jgi:hypothetical protein
MRWSSSSLNSVLRTAARLSSSCATLEAPMSDDVTRGSRSVHAIAICASDWPRSRAMSFSARTWPRFSSDRKSRASDLPCVAREPSGIPSR